MINYIFFNDNFIFLMGYYCDKLLCRSFNLHHLELKTNLLS